MTVGLEGEAEIVGMRLAARPSGAEYLRSAEEVERGLTKGFGLMGVGIPRITRDLRLCRLSSIRILPFARSRPEKPVDYSLVTGHCHVNRKFADQGITAVTVHAATVA